MEMSDYWKAGVKKDLKSKSPIVPIANRFARVVGKKRADYDVLNPRHFEFIPFWGILVFFVYAMRRVNCPVCGIKVEKVP